MRQALAADDGMMTYPRISRTAPEFVPKERTTTARETKISSLYGLGAKESVKEEGTAEYPLAKMAGRDQNTENRRVRHPFSKISLKKSILWIYPL